MYTWAHERQNSAYGVTFTDRFLRFVAVSMIFHLLLAWPEYALYYAAVAGRDEVLAGQFALLWLGLLVLVAVPASLGTMLGGLYATRTNRSGWGMDPPPLVRRGRAAPTGDGSRPHSGAPRLGQWLAGKFADASYAGGFPHDADLYLEEAWEVDQVTGALGNVGLAYPVDVPPLSSDG